MLSNAHWRRSASPRAVAAVRAPHIAAMVLDALVLDAWSLAIIREARALVRSTRV